MVKVILCKNCSNMVERCQCTQDVTYCYGLDKSGKLKWKPIVHKESLNVQFEIKEFQQDFLSINGSQCKVVTLSYVGCLSDSGLKSLLEEHLFE